MRYRPGALFALALAVALLLPPASPRTSAQQTLSQVLSLAAQYVSAFTDTSRILLCEESYKHTFLRQMLNAANTMERIPQGGHEWVAEMAVVATPDDVKNGYPWFEFRDILTLDGKPRHEGKSRLDILASQPFGLAGPEALRITRETTSAQFGRLDRSVLLPRLTIVFLEAFNQPRFAFRKGGDRTIQGIKTWEVKFEETSTPTIITGSTGKDARSTGSFWIDPATGHVLSSRLKNGDSSTLYDEMTVNYALDKATGLWLPATMSNHTTDSEEEREVEGKGTFTNWRFVPRTSK